MSYTRSFIGETEFDRQALKLDPDQSGVPLWKIYDPRSEGLPSNLRYDLSGLGNLGRGGSALSMDLKQAQEDCQKASKAHQEAKAASMPKHLIEIALTKARARCKHAASLKSDRQNILRRLLGPSSEGGGPRSFIIATTIVVALLLSTPYLISMLPLSLQRKLGFI